MGPPAWGQTPPPAWGQTPPPGWNANGPSRRSGACGGRGCGCLLLVLVLAVVAAIGVFLLADDGRLMDPGAGGPPVTSPLEGTVAAALPVVVGTGTATPGTATTVTVPAGGPLAGTVLDVPADAYADPVEFTIGAADVTLDGFGGKVTALSDLLVVENGGAWAEAPVRVTIPVTVPAGSIAMGFLRHDDGSLEALPLVRQDAGSVTIATRHFSALLVLAIAEAALPENIGTGFRPREDDFQITNYGAFVAPRGFCTGQSIAAVWYFNERKAAGAPQLWGLTDNLGRGGTIEFWQDDRDAVRLSAMIQKDADFLAWPAWLLEKGMKADVDRLQWNAFRFAMYVTGEPQLVGLYETDKEGGHEIVAYAATPTGLWVADPNFPGKLRTIAWNAGARRFDPYQSGPTAEESKAFYDLIGLDAQSALVRWDTLAARWAEVAAGTIGDKRFPGLTMEIEVTDAAGVVSYQPLVSGPIPTTTPRLAFSGLTPGTVLRATVYNGTTRLGVVGDGKVAPFTLAYGINDVGVLVEGKVDTSWEYVDFQRFELVAPAPSGMPTAAPAEPTPEPTYDCSRKPSGQIDELDWSLHCEAIGTFQP